jgi:ankyrin repeat protein
MTTVRKNTGFIRPAARICCAFIAIILFTACTGEQYSELMSAASIGDTEGVLRIIARGSDVNERTRQGKTPLLLAARTGHTETVKTLILKGADINAQDANGTTPLIAAATYDYTDTVRILIEKGANPNIRDNNNGTALINAVFFNYRDTVNEILKTKSDIAKDDLEEAFLLASGLGNTKIVSDMLKLGIDVNAKGHNDRTPLMAAINFDHADTVKVLLDGGATLNTKDSNGHTPLSLALDQGNDEIIKMLKSAKK